MRRDPTFTPFNIYLILKLNRRRDGCKFGNGISLEKRGTRLVENYVSNEPKLN